MKINIRQTEIVSALKQYITAQGINLSGKTVEISFTAGRGQTGLTADLTIEDAEIPGVTELEQEQVPPPALLLVQAPVTLVVETEKDPKPVETSTKVDKTVNSLFS